MRLLVGLVLLLVATASAAPISYTVSLPPSNEYGANGIFGTADHPFSQLLRYVAATENSDEFTGLLQLNEIVSEVVGDDDLRAVISLSRNHAYLFACSPTHVHVLKFHGVGVTWLHKVAVAHSPYVRLQPIGNSASFYAFVRPHGTMTPNWLPTGSWRRFEGGVETGSMGPTMFGTPSMAWVGIGLVQTGTLLGDVAGVPNLQDTPTTRLPLAGCRFTEGEGFPEPCDVDGYAIVPAIDENSTATLEEEDYEASGQWDEAVFTPVAVFNALEYPGVISILAQQLEYNASTPDAQNVRWYVHAETIPTDELTPTISWARGLGREAITDGPVELEGVCPFLPWVVNSTHLDFGLVRIELTPGGGGLLFYCGGDEKLYMVQAGLGDATNIRPPETTDLPEWSDLTYANVSIDLTAPDPETALSGEAFLSMSQPVAIMTHTIRTTICDEDECVLVRVTDDVYPLLRATVTIDGVHVGPWLDAVPDQTTTPRFFHGTLPGKVLEVNVEADLDDGPPYLAFKCVLGPCEGDSFEVPTVKVSGTTTHFVFRATLGNQFTGVGQWRGLLTVLSPSVRTYGHINVLVQDTTPEPPAFGAMFSFGDEWDPDVVYETFAVLGGVMGDFVLATAVEGELHLFNVSRTGDMGMPGLALPSEVGAEGHMEWPLVGGLETSLGTLLDPIHGVAIQITATHISFFQIDATNVTVEPELIYAYEHELALQMPGAGEGGRGVLWSRFDPATEILSIHTDNTDTEDPNSIAFIAFEHLFDGGEPGVRVVSEAPLTISGGAYPCRAAVTFGGEHVLIGTVEGLMRYVIRPTGQVDEDYGETAIVKAPGTVRRRDFSDADIACSPSRPICVVANVDEVLVVAHAVTPMGTVPHDAVVTQVFQLDDRKTSATHPHSVSFSPDGTKVIIVSRNWTSPGFDEDTPPYALHLFQVHEDEARLILHESLTLEDSMEKAVAWRPDGNSVVFQRTDNVVEDVTLYAMAAAPVAMATATSVMYAAFEAPLMLEEMCVTLTVHLEDENGLTSTLIFTDVDSGMVMITLDICMLDNSRADSGGWGGISGATKLEGHVTFSATCTTLTGQSETSNEMVWDLDCQEPMTSSSLAVGDPTVIIAIVWSAAVLVLGAMVGSVAQVGGWSR